MNEYKGYIYLTICEISLNFYNGSNYKTYGEYCKGMLKSISNCYLNIREKNDIIEIHKRLEKEFSLTYVEIGEFISEYFSLPLERLEMIESTVISTNNMFPFNNIFV